MFFFFFSDCRLVGKFTKLNTLLLLQFSCWARALSLCVFICIYVCCFYNNNNKGNIKPNRLKVLKEKYAESSRRQSCEAQRKYGIRWRKMFVKSHTLIHTYIHTHTHTQQVIYVCVCLRVRVCGN